MACADEFLLGRFNMNIEGLIKFSLGLEQVVNLIFVIRVKLD
jgi:hypothetical protein